jgi:hypothetical protein
MVLWLPIGPEGIADLVALNNHRRAARIIAAMQSRVSATPGRSNSFTSLKKFGEPVAPLAIAGAAARVEAD